MLPVTARKEDLEKALWSRFGQPTGTYLLRQGQVTILEGQELRDLSITDGSVVEMVKITGTLPGEEK